jgi:Zn-dependent protease
MAPPILFALTIHEFAHGYVALSLGDPTAKDLGRLTLNPLKHLDPIGTIVFFIFNFGWAKPVPVNSNYFKDPRKGMLWVALAGPVTNLVVAIISVLLAKLIIVVESFFTAAIFLAILNPVKIMLVYSVLLNLILCVFNFIPIPPLDGSRVLAGILPPDLARSYESMERYGFIILVLLMFTPVIPALINPINHFVQNLFF